VHHLPSRNAGRPNATSWYQDLSLARLHREPVTIPTTSRETKSAAVNGNRRAAADHDTSKCMINGTTIRAVAPSEPDNRCEQRRAGDECDEAGPRPAGSPGRRRAYSGRGVRIRGPSA